MIQVLDESAGVHREGVGFVEALVKTNDLDDVVFLTVRVACRGRVGLPW